MNDRYKKIGKLTDWWIDFEDTMLSENITFLYEPCNMTVFILLKTCKIMLPVTYGYAYIHVEDLIPN